MNIVTKSYESLLPFLVVEAISSQRSSFNTMSVRLMDRGWAWLVSGRKLLIWKFKESKAPNVTTRQRRTLSPCFELQLPQSDLIHKAELINVFFMPQNPNASLRAITVPAALAISPEGTIRFWLSIANERFAESSVVDMQGQEFCTLVPLSQIEYLVGTTTGSVHLLTIDVNSADHKTMVVCSSLDAPSGLLSGISRRMTNLFFGPMAAEAGANESRRPLIAVSNHRQVQADRPEIGDRTFFVMSSALKLRHWSRANEGTSSQNQLIREWDLQKNIYRKLASALNIPDTHRLNFWPIDMITTDAGELLILIVTLDTSRDNTINYATCSFNPYQAGDRIGKVKILSSHSWQYTNESEEQLLALRFLERQISSPMCFLYDRKFLFLARIDRDILDAVDFANQDDGILGAGFIDGQPVLFTQRDGLTCVAPVVCDASQIDINETIQTLQSESVRHDQSSVINQSRLGSHRKSMSSNRVEPMLVEIDDEEDDEQENDRSRAQVNESRRRLDERTKQFTTDKTALEPTVASKSTDQAVPRRKGDDVNEFIKENKEFEWIQQIELKRYEQASEILAKLAEESETLQDRKDTLLALSKLAGLAA